MIGVLFCIIVSFIGGVLAQAPTAVLTPAEGFNASLGSTIKFNCTVVGTTDVVWRIDENSNPADHTARGIIRLGDLEEPDGTIISMIQVSATMENDGIEIQCRAVGDTQVGSSSIEIFRVQGLLDSPSSLGITDLGSGMQRLSWEAPDSLDITNVDPDISHYNVCITILSEMSCRNVPGLEYEFVSVRVEIEFTVATVNIVGEGSVSVISYAPCDSGTGE